MKRDVQGSASPPEAKQQRTQTWISYRGTVALRYKALQLGAMYYFSISVHRYVAQAQQRAPNSASEAQRAVLPTHRATATLRTLLSNRPFQPRSQLATAAYLPHPCPPFRPILLFSASAPKYPPIPPVLALPPHSHPTLFPASPVAPIHGPVRVEIEVQVKRTATHHGYLSGRSGSWS